MTEFLQRGIFGTSRCESNSPPVWMTCSPLLRVAGCAIIGSSGGTGSYPATRTRSCWPLCQSILIGQSPMSTGTICPGIRSCSRRWVWKGSEAVESFSSSSRWEARSLPVGTGVGLFHTSGERTLPRSSSFWTRTNRSASSAPLASIHKRSFM